MGRWNGQSGRSRIHGTVVKPAAWQAVRLWLILMLFGALSGPLTSSSAQGTTPTPSGVPPRATPTSPLLAITTTPTIVPTLGILPGGPPPFSIVIPNTWKYSFQIIPVRDRLTQANINMAIFTGPLKGGTATIVALWGFPSLAPPPTRILIGSPTPTPGTPGPSFQMQAIWADGLRLLQGAVVDATCNVGNYGQTFFSVGGQPAIGETFAASQCQGEPDVVGWYAGLYQFNLNILFYALVEPITVFNDARADLQKMLDSVIFLPPRVATAPATAPATAGAPATNTPRTLGAITATPRPR